MTRSYCIIFISLLLLKGLTVAGAMEYEAEQDERILPYDDLTPIVLPKDDRKNILHLSGYFKYGKPHIGTRKLTVTVNGEVLSEKHLLSSKIFFQMRAQPPVLPRMGSGGKHLVMPYTHRAGGLADFSFKNLNEYDLWVEAYSDLDDSVYFDLSGMRPDKNGFWKIVLRLDGSFPSDPLPETRKRGPSFILRSCQLVEKWPSPTSNPGTFIAPLWKALLEYPELERMARDRRDDEKGDPSVRAQCWAQFGLLHQMKNESLEAAACFKKAVSISDRFPEYAEAHYRLLTIEKASSIEQLPAGDDRWGWATLFNAYIGIMSGKESERLIRVRRWPGVWDSDTHAEALEQAPGHEWYNLSHLVHGEKSDDHLSRFKVAYNKEGLIFLGEGPAPLQINAQDLPGEDREVWNFDCFEFFISPDAALTTYFELNVSAGHGRFDGKHRWNRIDGQAWNGSWKSHVKNGENRLRVSIFVPYSDVGIKTTPGPETVMLLNVIRIACFPSADGKKGGSSEYSLGKLKWRNFHRLQDGQFLKFE